MGRVYEWFGSIFPGGIGILLLLVVSCQAPENKILKASSQPEKVPSLLEHAYSRMVLQRNLSMDSMRYFYSRISVLPEERPELQAKKDLCIAAYHKRNGSHHLGGLYYQKVLRQTGDKGALAYHALTGLAHTFSNRGNFPAALWYLQQALINCESRPDSEGRTHCANAVYANMGKLYFEKNEEQKAREYLQKVLAHAPDSQSIGPYLSALHTLANIEGKSGNYEEAMRIDQNGLDLCQRFDDQVAKVSFQDNLARCYLYYLKDYRKAKYFFEENLETDKKLNNLKWVADSYINLGEVAAAEGNHAQARAYTEKAIQIFKETGDLNNALKGYLALIQLHEQKGDYRNAFRAQGEYMKVYKKAFNEKSEQLFAEYTTLFETGQKEKALTEAQLFLAKEMAASRQKSIWLLVFGSLIIISAILAVNVRTKLRLRDKKLQLEKQVMQEQNLLQIQNQRLEIARDLHDSMGAQLGFMSALLSDLQAAPDTLTPQIREQLDALSDCAITSIAELRSTLWALGSSSIDLEDFKIKILNFIGRAERAQQQTQIHFRFEGIENRILETRQAVNLFRAVQEIVSNALKHAAAQVIDIVIEQKGATLLLRISDNGSGFDLEAKRQKNDSFGLANIQRRIEESNGQLQITTAPGKGTSYSIELILTDLETESKTDSGV